MGRNEPVLQDFKISRCGDLSRSFQLPPSPAVRPSHRTSRLIHKFKHDE